MKLSYSRMNTYLTCGIKYEKKYIEKLPSPSTPVLVTGTAVHAGIEVNYKQKINTRKDLPVSDLQDAAADAVEAKFQDELFLTEEEKTVGKEKLRGITKDLAVRGVKAYHENISPHVMPLAAEHEFLIPLWDNHELYGFIDVADERAIIRDTKTSKKSPVSSVAETSGQLTTYALAYESQYGEMPKKLCLDYVVLNNSRPQVKVLETSRSEQHVQAFFKRVARVIRGIEAGVFLPPTETWTCLYCQYRDLCEEKLA